MKKVLLIFTLSLLSVVFADNRWESDITYTDNGVENVMSTLKVEAITNSNQKYAGFFGVSCVNEELLILSFGYSGKVLPYPEEVDIRLLGSEEPDGLYNITKIDGLFIWDFSETYNLLQPLIEADLVTIRFQTNDGTVILSSFNVGDIYSTPSFKYCLR